MVAERSREEKEERKQVAPRSSYNDGELGGTRGGSSPGAQRWEQAEQRRFVAT
jgi:hypothetical protein